MNELHTRVDSALRTHVAPALELDGGAIELLDIDRGCARVRLHGSCSSCPSTVMFLVRGIEDELRKHIPEIDYLEAVP